MAKTKTGRKLVKPPQRGLTEWGRSAELMDRRREVWNLRVRGHSYRSIGNKLGISPAVAWNDCVAAEKEWGSLIDNPAVVQQMLLQVQQQAVGHLLTTLEEQATSGQVVAQLDADGNVVGSQVRRGVNPQVAAELGRTTERMARLLGILDTTTADDGQATQQTTVVVLNPLSDGNAFEAAAAAVAVDAEATAVPSSPEALEPATEPPTAG